MVLKKRSKKVKKETNAMLFSSKIDSLFFFYVEKLPLTVRMPDVSRFLLKSHFTVANSVTFYKL